MHRFMILYKDLFGTLFDQFWYVLLSALLKQGIQGGLRKLKPSSNCLQNKNVNISIL